MGSCASDVVIPMTIINRNASLATYRFSLSYFFSSGQRNHSADDNPLLLYPLVHTITSPTDRRTTRPI